MFHGEMTSSRLRARGAILLFALGLLLLAPPARAQSAAPAPSGAAIAGEARKKVDALFNETGQSHEDSVVTCSPSRITKMGQMADEAHRAFVACQAPGAACPPELKPRLIEGMTRVIRYLHTRKPPCPEAVAELWRFLNRVNIPLDGAEKALIEIAEQLRKRTGGHVDPGAARDAVEIAFRLQEPETRRRFLLQIEALKQEGKQVPQALEKAVTENQNIPQALLEAGRAYMALAFDFTRELDYQTRMQPDFSGLIRLLFVRKGAAPGAQPPRTRTFENAIKELLTAETGNGIEPPVSSVDDTGALAAVCSCQKDPAQAGRCAAVLQIELSAQDKSVEAAAHLILNDQALKDGCAAGRLAEPSQDKIAKVELETCDGRQPACLPQIEAAAAMLRSLRFSVLGSLAFLGRNRAIEYLGEPLDPSTTLSDIQFPAREDAPKRLAARPGLQIAPGSGSCAGKFRDGLVARLVGSYHGEIGEVTAGEGDPAGRHARLLIEGDGKTCKAVLWHNDRPGETTSTLGVPIYGVTATAARAGEELGEQAGRSAARVIGEFYRDAFHVHWQPPRLPECKGGDGGGGQNQGERRHLSTGQAAFNAALFSGAPWLVDRDGGNDRAGVAFSVLESAAIITGAALMLWSVNQRNEFGASRSLDDMSNPDTATRTLRFGLGTIFVGVPVIRLASWLTYLGRKEKS
jgi:hypothetical protein